MQPQRLKHIKNIYPEIQGLLDWQKVVDASDLDAVAIATPLRYHYEMAKASLLAGKHTLIEKPMASSTEQCEELIHLAERMGLVLLVGHTVLYSPAVRRMKEIVLAGDVGSIRYIGARRLNLGAFQKDINVLWDQAAHDLSTILYLMDEAPHTVNCSGGSHINRSIEDNTSTWLSFSNQRSALIQNSWLEPRRVREMTVVGTRRMIVCDDVEMREKIKIYDTRVESPPYYDSFAEFQYSYHYGHVYIPHVAQEEPLRVECQHFLDCILQGEIPLTCGHKGMEVVRILEACSESLRSGGASVGLSRDIPARSDAQPASRSPDQGWAEPVMA